MLGRVSHAVGVVVGRGAERVGVEVAEVGVHRGLAVQTGVEAGAAGHGGHRCHPAGDRLGGRGDAGQRVLVVQLRQSSHEALGEPLLLVGDILGAQELRRGRRGGDQPVAGLDDEPLQLGRGQFEEPHVGRGEDVGVLVPQVRLQVAGGVGQVQRHVLLQHLGVIVSVPAALRRREAGAQRILVESRLHLCTHRTQSGEGKLPGRRSAPRGHPDPPGEGERGAEEGETRSLTGSPLPPPRWEPARPGGTPRRPPPPRAGGAGTPLRRHKYFPCPAPRYSRSTVPAAALSRARSLPPAPRSAPAPAVQPFTYQRPRAR